jgi:arylsulfatase A-like enzyme
VVATGVLYQKIDRGFDVVVDTEEEWKAEVTTDHAIRELEQAEEPYFLWVFYRDPHMPYQTHGLTFDSDYDGRFKHFLGFKEIRHGELFHKNPMTEREREHAVALYDSEILYLDREIGRLLDYIEERGDDPIIVFLSDHGESLGEHDYYFEHGDLLNQPSIRVPLIIKGLDFPGSRVEKTVRLIDVSPTILNRLGRRPDIEVTGVDLVAHANDEGARLLAFSETGKAFYQEAYDVGRRHLEGIPGRLRSVVDNDRKLIYIPTREGISWELYDLKSDPGELTNIFPRRSGPEITQLMRQLEEVAHSGGGDDEGRTLTEEERQRLRTLGYMN